MSNNKYVKVDDVMNLINTTNRGNCDYFIVDKIEELCNSNNIYDIDKVVEELEGNQTITFNLDGGTPIQTIDLETEIEIVKAGGKND